MWAISGKYLNSDGDLKEADESASYTADGLEIDIDEEAPQIAGRCGSPRPRKAKLNSNSDQLPRRS
jgi:hypothetical protein